MVWENHSHLVIQQKLEHCIPRIINQLPIIFIIYDNIMLYVLSTLCLAFARLVTIPELGLSSLRNILGVTGALKPLFKH